MSASNQRLVFVDAHKLGSLQTTADRAIAFFNARGVLAEDVRVSVETRPSDPFAPSTSTLETIEIKTWVAGPRWEEAVDKEILARAVAQKHPTFFEERTATLSFGWSIFGSDAFTLRCPHCDSDAESSEWFDIVIEGPDAVATCAACGATFRGDEVACDEYNAFGSLSLDLGPSWVRLSTPFLDSVASALGCRVKLVWERW